MAEVAAHLTDHVLPHLPVRQWVLSLPKRLRAFLHHTPDAASTVLRIFLRAPRATLRRTSPGAPADAQLAALSFPQRFGSSLNPHFHFHVLALDGVFSEEQATGQLRFHEATQLSQDHWHEVERTGRGLRRRSYAAILSSYWSVRAMASRPFSSVLTGSPQQAGHAPGAPGRSTR